MIIGWKVVLQAAAVTGAMGVTAASMFGADSASKPPPVHAAPAKPSASTTTSTVPVAAPVDATGVAPSGSGGGGSGGSGGGGGGGDGSGFVGSDPGSGAVGPTATTVTTVSTVVRIQPPTVDESGTPIALPISAAVVVGATAGGIALSRRRARARSR